MKVALQLRAGFCCMLCGEILHVPPTLRDEELDNAMAGFMVDHIMLHGGDPLKVPFSIPFEGVLMRAET